MVQWGELTFGMPTQHITIGSSPSYSASEPLSANVLEKQRRMAHVPEFLAPCGRPGKSFWLSIAEPWPSLKRQILGKYGEMIPKLLPEQGTTLLGQKKPLCSLPHLSPLFLQEEGNSTGCGHSKQKDSWTRQYILKTNFIVQPGTYPCNSISLKLSYILWPLRYLIQTWP